MRRHLLAILMALVLILASVGAAQAANLAGKWTASYKGAALVLQLKGSGSSYSGTYALTATVKIGKKKPQVLHEVQPIKAVVKITQDVSHTTITNVILTFPAHKVTSNCVLLKGQLRCLAPASQSVIIFKHVAH